MNKSMNKSMLDNILIAKEECENANGIFDLTAYIHANNLSTDLTEWHNYEDEEEITGLTSINVSDDNDFFCSEMKNIFDQEEQKTPTELITNLLSDCNLEGLILPVFTTMLYSNCNIINCKFTTIGGKKAKLSFYSSNVVNCVLTEEHNLSELSINKSTFTNMTVWLCDFDSLELINNTFTFFNLIECNIENTNINKNSFIEYNIFYNKFRNCTILTESVFKNQDDSIWHFTQKNCFLTLHKVKNLGCEKLDICINELKITEARENLSTIISIPYSMNGRTTNADTLLNFYIERGGYNRAESRYLLNYIIYLDNTTPLNDIKKYYLEESHLCVLPGGENIPQQYYQTSTYIPSLLNKKGTFNINLLRDKNTFNDPRTNSELEILDFLKNNNKLKVVGICRGMQIMAVFFGATIDNCHENHSHAPDTHYMSVSKRTDINNSILTFFNHKLQKKSSAKNLAVINDEDNQTLNIKISCQHHQKIVLDEKTISNILPVGIRRSYSEEVIEACEFPNHPNWFGIQNHPESLLKKEEAAPLEPKIAKSMILNFLSSPTSLKKNRSSPIFNYDNFSSSSANASRTTSPVNFDTKEFKEFKLVNHV